MFCKHCGNEINDDALFCSKCGKRVNEQAAENNTSSQSSSSSTATRGANYSQPEQENATQFEQGKPSSATEVAKIIKDKIEKTNPLCIAGLVLTIIMFFINYYGVVSYAAFVLSLVGFRHAKERRQKGAMLAIICMAVAGIMGLISIMRIVEYQRYAAASYGAASGIWEWLLD